MGILGVSALHLAGPLFIVDEAKSSPRQGVAPGATVADLLADKKCPNPGTDKANLHPRPADVSHATFEAAIMLSVRAIPLSFHA